MKLGQLQRRKLKVDKMRVMHMDKRRPPKIALNLKVTPELFERIEVERKEHEMQRNEWMVDVISKHIKDIDERNEWELRD